MPTGTVMPVPKQQFCDATGAPLAGGKLYTYVAGTSTPLATYSDVLLTTPNTNPVILDSAGRALVYLSASSYKFTLKDSLDATVYTVDTVASTALASSNLGGSIFEFGGDPTSPITVTSLPSGTTYDKCHAGTAWFYEDSANLVGTYALECMLYSVGGVTVTASLVNLSDGTPDTPLVSVTSTSSTGERQRSSGITFATGGSSKTYAIKTKVSGGTGMVWACSLIRTA